MGIFFIEIPKMGRFVLLLRPPVMIPSLRGFHLHQWLLFFFLVFPAHSCYTGDLEALHDFLSDLETNIPGWSAASGDCCRWSGVTCSGERVVGVNLFNRSLKGYVSSSLAELDKLRWLNLSSNSLKGSVPSTILQLPELELLDFSANFFSGAVGGAGDGIKLPLIRVFNISHNYFNGSLPTLMGSNNLTSFDLGFNFFTGRLDPSLCDESTELTFISFSTNLIGGDFPPGFSNCSSLVTLMLDANSITGLLPEDLFKIQSLQHLTLQSNLIAGNLDHRLRNLSNLIEIDISFNNFFGEIPMDVFDGFQVLESFSAQGNRFNGELPPSLFNSSAIKTLSLRNNSFSGDLNGFNFSALVHLTMLDLGSNAFTGTIPQSLSKCSELKTLNLANNSFSGEIPRSFANLTSLSFLSLSFNNLSGISSALRTLQSCESLATLVLTKSFVAGESIPSAEIAGFPNMELLVLANNGLAGFVPPWLASCRSLKVLDLSWNKLSGEIPTFFDALDFLFYLDLSNNSLAGVLPESLTKMKSLINQVSVKQMEIAMTQDFPFLIKKNLSGKGLPYYQVSSFPSSLVLANNELTGQILPDLGNLKMLHVMDLSKNRLSGEIPSELSGMISLEKLDLSHNTLSGSIPSSLSKLTFLSYFDVSFNNLSGRIPVGGQFSTFSSSDFEGNPYLCEPHLPSSCAAAESTVTGSPSTRRKKNKWVIAGMAVGIGFGAFFLLFIIYIVVSRSGGGGGAAADEYSSGERSGSSSSSSSELVLLFRQKNDNPTEKLCIQDILMATNNFDPANIVGCGGFGLVYKADLPDGRRVAIKRLSGDFNEMEREFQAEIETLSRAQHPNLVLLQGYCKFNSDRLLIYSFMVNGCLDSWLHESEVKDAINTSTFKLDWKTRLRIAQGAAKGLDYLHRKCDPHILHRDIKSSNILLDEAFEAHLADFGLARLVLPQDTHVTTDLVGTLGYIPPEYGQTAVATFKGDVYSFGVVLLELVTGRRPVDPCRDVIGWVMEMKMEKKELQVFDPSIFCDKNETEMMKMLEIACLCLRDTPRERPSTQNLVSWLEAIDNGGGAHHYSS